MDNVAQLKEYLRDISTLFLQLKKEPTNSSLLKELKQELDIYTQTLNNLQQSKNTSGIENVVVSDQEDA